LQQAGGVSRLSEEDRRLHGVTPVLRNPRHEVPHVLDLDTVQCGDRVDQGVRIDPFWQFDRELIDRSGAVALEDVDADEVAPQLPDSAGELPQ
jgi:hypothetical protein